MPIPLLLLGLGALGIAGIGGFLIGERKGKDELQEEIKKEYYKCISTLSKKLPPSQAKKYCKFESDDISLGKIAILGGSILIAGLALYGIAPKINNLKTSKQVKQVKGGVPYVS